MFTRDYFYFSMNSPIQTYSEPIHFCVHRKDINYFLHREDDLFTSAVINLFYTLFVRHNFANKLLILVDVFMEDKLLGSVYQVD